MPPPGDRRCGGQRPGLDDHPGVGLLGLVRVDRYTARHRGAPVGGPGAATVHEFSTPLWHESASRLAVMIAVGIGLHNFAEGLAIGNSAAAGNVGLAVMLVIGFALHNGTEGFGIVAPLTGPPAVVGLPGDPRFDRRRNHLRGHAGRPTVHQRDGLDRLPGGWPPVRLTTS